MWAPFDSTTLWSLFGIDSITFVIISLSISDIFSTMRSFNDCLSVMTVSNTWFQISLEPKSIGILSGDRGGQLKSKYCPITPQSKLAARKSLTFFLIWGHEPSCWKNVFLNARLLRRNGTTWFSDISKYLFPVTFLSKKYGSTMKFALKPHQTITCSGYNSFSTKTVGFLSNQIHLTLPFLLNIASFDHNTEFKSNSCKARVAKFILVSKSCG